MQRLLILLLLLSLQACANDNKRETEENQVKGKEMTRAEIFGEKPIYKLRIKAEGAAVIVKINGVEIYKNFSGSKAFMLQTVNDLIASKDNSISITLADEKYLSKDAWGSVTLEVFSEEKHYVLNSLVLNMSKKDKTSDSTKMGSYSYDVQKELVSNVQGKIRIGEITVEPDIMYQSDKHDGMKAKQTFSLPTPYPKWKFLDSKNIIEEDYNHLSQKEYEKLKKTPKIQALYAVDAKIRKALKSKNPQGIIDLFNERFEEGGIAFYDTPQNMKKILLEDFVEYVNNSDAELIERSEDEHYFVIEENKKLAWLRPIAYYDKKTGLYHSYNIKYRLNKEGEWVITK